VCRYPVSFIADYITNHHDAAWHMTHNTLLGGTHAVIPALLKLQKQNQRIFVYHGEDDTSCQISLSEEMVRRFTNVELHTVPGFGHVDVLWKREEEPCRFIEAEILAGDAKFSPPCADGSR
jgi:pimeloyl-ACP methyl ester carboxylesterase